MNRSADLSSSFFSKLFLVSVQNYYILEFPFLKFILVVSTANIGVAIIFAGIGAAALASSSSTLAFFGVAILPAIFYLSYKKFIG